MRILVFGAGVIGCNLARNLFRAGKDVTLLARGAWAEDIQKNGLRIKDKFSPRMSVTRIPVVTELKPEDQYDVIFVVMRYTQVGAIMDTLRANPAKNIVFVGNDVRAEETPGMRYSRMTIRSLRVQPTARPACASSSSCARRVSASSAPPTTP